MNYTIRLTHGSAFWTTIFDADGASWSSGPYHAGTNQDVGCLATLTGQEGVGGVMADAPKAKGKGVGIGALAGGIAGAFVAGLILAALAMILLAKKKKRSHVCPSFTNQNRNGADGRTEMDQQNLWTVITIPNPAPQPGDPIPTPQSPNTPTHKPSPPTPNTRHSQT